MSCAKSQLTNLQSGVVSLLEMLQIGAADLYKLGEELNQFCTLPQVLTSQRQLQRFQRMLDVYQIYCDDMGLKLSSNQIKVIVAAVNAKQSWQQLRSHFQQLQTRVFEELQSQALYYIPANKSAFAAKDWPHDDDAIHKSFPSALKELQKAGRCFAYDENDACAFHAMRALEIGLNSLAAALNVDFDRTNWHTVIERIESAIRKQSAGPRKTRKIEAEQFYAAAAAHFMYLKDAWRNHVMHYHAVYSERETKEILDHSQKFLSRLSLRLREK